jgi:hypothetical protein
MIGLLRKAVTSAQRSSAVLTLDIAGTGNGFKLDSAYHVHKFSATWRGHFYELIFGDIKNWLRVY